MAASWDHEGLVELLRKEPQLVVKLLETALGVQVPEFSEARIEPSTMAELKPAEIHADLVVVLRAGSRPVLSIAVEVQRKEDADKLFAWPAYVAWLRRNLRAPACVLVITQSERVANWAARTIVLGPGGTLQPLVLRPSLVPVIDTLDDARKGPELAVLSAMVHGAGPLETAVAVALTASAAASELDRDRFVLYFGLIRAALSEAARKVFQMHPQGARFFDESQQQSFERGRTEGRTEGQTEAKSASVFAVLEARGLPISPAQRERILATTDLATLDRWIRRAATVSDVDALFD
jgi:hypothetical protein